MAVPVAAEASTPAHGLYRCYVLPANSYLGALTIKAHHKYDWEGDGGTYDYKSASRKIVFHGGGLASSHWYGKYQVHGSTPEIDLYKKNGTNLHIRCN